MSAVPCAAFRSAALPVRGSRRVATAVESSTFAEGFCFLAAPKRGERPHQRQSEPNFSLRLLVSQLSSSPAFLCKPLEHARNVHRRKARLDGFPTTKYFHEFSTFVCRPDDNPHVPLPLAARQRSKLSERRSPRSHAISEREDA